MTPKIVNLFKSYFVFSKTERRGILALVIVGLLLAVAPYAYRFFFPSEPFELAQQTISNVSYDAQSGVSDHPPRLTYFDPNTATDEQFVQLGLSNKQIRSIRSYIEKGGQFRRPSDFCIMYMIDKKTCTALSPYIRIDQNGPGAAKNLQLHKQVGEPLELNTADSVALVKLYRVGPAMAKRIIEYRDKLGGFLFVEQLKEIWGFDEDVLYDLDGRITVDASKARIWNVNEVEEAQLRTHPYFKYKLSGAIVNFRKQHGAYQSLEDLKKIVIVNDSIYRRIILYLKL